MRIHAGHTAISVSIFVLLIACLPNDMEHSPRDTSTHESEAERPAPSAESDWKSSRLKFDPSANDSTSSYEGCGLYPMASLQVDACDSDGICWCFPTGYSYRTTVRSGRHFEPQRTAASSRPEWESPRLTFEPPLIEATLGSDEHPLRLTTPVQLSVCNADGTCRPLEQFEVGSLIWRNGKTLSKSAEFAYAWVELPDRKHVISIYSTTTSSIIGTCEFDDGISPSYTSSRLVPVGGEGVMASWGAGSGVSVAFLCTKDGELRQPRGDGPYEFSDGRRYAASYPHYGTPAASSRRIIIEDLVNGAYVATTPPSIGYGYVEDIRWEDDVAVMTIIGRDNPTDDETFTTKVKLPLP